MIIIKKIQDIIKQLLLVILYFFIVIITSLILYKDINSKNIYLFTISNIFADLILIVTFIFLFKKIIVPNFYDFKKNWKTYLKDNLIYYLLGFIVMNISLSLLNRFIGMPINEETNRNYLNLYPVYTIFATLISAPIVEELMTRTILKDTFKHPIIYILLSGLIFGSLHIISIITTGDLKELLFIIPYGALGCSLAYMYYKTNNIWTNISFHFLHNLMCIILFFGA